MAILHYLQPPEDVAPALVARQGGMILTQVITRPYTTFTYLVTLGDATDLPTTTATPAPTLVAPAPVSHSSGSDGLSQSQIGAILGSVVAFVVIVLLIWYCVSLRAQAVYRVAALESDSYTTGTVESSETPVVHDPWGGAYAQNPVRGPTLNPAPPRFPPTAMPATYRATAHPQIRGVRRYP